MGRVRRKISPHAARLRRDATDVERKLWAVLRSRQCEGFKFRRQATQAPFVVDFLCVEAGLIVELDGSQHNETVDARRTARLERDGLEVIRFWNSEVIENLDGVAEAIRLALLRRVAEIHESGSPQMRARTKTLSRLREREGPARRSRVGG